MSGDQENDNGETGLETSPVDVNIPDESVMLLEDISMTEAKLTELDSWKQNKVYKEIPDEGQKCISTRWVCTLKATGDRIKPKARLVARGFEEIDNDQIQKDSPTCSKESMRLILAIMAQNRWKPRSMDIKVPGKEIERDVFIRPPREADCPNKLWHLQKCVYGLGDASLHWYYQVKAVMIETGAQMSKVDPAVFYWVDERVNLIGVFVIVDDFMWAGDSKFEESIARARVLETESPLTENEKDLLRSKVGQILWIACQSRPDVLFDACMSVRKLKSDSVPVKFQHLGDGELSLVVFSDASLGNLPDGSSQGGYLIFLMGETGKFSPICWNSKKIRRVVRSTLAGETLAMADGIDSAMFISTLYVELTGSDSRYTKLPLVCVTDCKSLYEAVKSTKLVSEKRLHIEVSGIRGTD
uniref:Uncharacterized protein LOC102802092 n=1 Tax=Saccoglossus kowalevskii TaxID=10224 RepID=A0ABM0M1M8_SACKO|nr:PREDICTED: uncharacterized protein LOC102802092 [Saccoglossus kowalevskii]